MENTTQHFRKFAPQGRFLYPIQNCIPFCTVIHYSRLRLKLKLEFFFRESAFKQKRCRLQNLNPIKSNLLHPVEEMYFVMDKDFFVVLKEAFLDTSRHLYFNPFFSCVVVCCRVRLLLLLLFERSFEHSYGRRGCVPTC